MARPAPDRDHTTPARGQKKDDGPVDRPADPPEEAAEAATGLDMVLVDAARGPLRRLVPPAGTAARFGSALARQRAAPHEQNTAGPASPLQVRSRTAAGAGRAALAGERQPPRQSRIGAQRLLIATKARPPGSPHHAGIPKKKATSLRWP